MRLSKVEYAPRAESTPIFNLYMGKNTPERKDYIMERLVVLMSDPFVWGGDCGRKTGISRRIEGGGEGAPALPMACAAVGTMAARREHLSPALVESKFLVTNQPRCLRKRV